MEPSSAELVSSLRLMDVEVFVDQKGFTRLIENIRSYILASTSLRLREVTTPCWREMFGPFYTIHISAPPSTVNVGTVLYESFVELVFQKCEICHNQRPASISLRGLV